MKKDSKGGKKKGKDWPFYDFGPLALAIGPHPDDEDSFGLFVVVGETGYAVAAYPDEQAAWEGSSALDEAIEAAAKEGGGTIHEEHAHGEHCDHDHGDGFTLELDDDKPKAKGGGGGKKPAPKPGKKGKR